MIFKSRQVNLDKEPWVRPDGSRWPEPWSDEPEFFEHAPRPEFEPTRDPEPWKNGLGERVSTLDGLPHDERIWFDWAPRREQFDTPVNRVLVAFRAVGDADAEAWAYCLLLAYTGESWPVVDHWDALEDAVEQIGDSGMDEIDHARRVLTRLANWREQ